MFGPWFQSEFSGVAFTLGGQVLMKIITVVNCVCACVRTSAEDDNFLKEGGGCVYLIILSESFYVLVCQR